MPKQRILIGSPIYQKPRILEKFLKSIGEQNKNTFTVEYMFVDDNIDSESTKLLCAFANEYPLVKIIKGEKTEAYVCNDETHYWNEDLMNKVGAFKNKIIDYAIANDFDYLFLVDSDLVLHPNLIEHLKALNKDIISEIFWCSWHIGAPKMPNVWLFNGYDFYPRDLDTGLDKNEERVYREKFLNNVKKPGVYEVGGLGACTLISKKALLAGVNFNPIKNLSLQGEDRFFCIRAIVLGLNLFVDTHFPAYHIYRDEDLNGVDEYINFCKAENEFVRKIKNIDNKVTLSMVVKNEEERFLSQMLHSLSEYIDEAVIIDDNSSDNTINICKKILKNIPLHIIKNESSIFENEVLLRKKQWDETIKTNPDWILNLDADEILDENFWIEKKALLNDKRYDAYAFRLYDMWNKTHYREDRYWSAHISYKTFLLRYQPDFPYVFNDCKHHCGRFPINIFNQPKKNLKHKIKHLGWSTEKIRSEKIKRYKLFDPDAIYGIAEQYASIMDVSPILKEYKV